MRNFYLDEQLSERLTEALARLGYDATSADRLGNKKLSDAAQLLIAADLNRVLISYDVNDFKLLHDARTIWPRAWNNDPTPTHPGMLLIHSSKNLDGIDVARAIDHIARTYHAIDNRLSTWRRHDGWSEET